MKFLKKAAVVGLLPLLAACASNWDVESAKMAPNSGDAFQKELQGEYARLAGLEREEGDWRDTRRFVKKAMAATSGPVDPQMISDRRLPESHVNELRIARNTLLTAFEQGGRTAAPQAAARAQAGFDCWMQEQEENFQPEDIEACKKYFEAGLRDMFAAMKKPEKKAEMKKMMDAVIVYFDFNSSMLNDEAKAMVKKAAMMAKDAGVLMVNGHTDTKGNDAYNEALALDRATVVGNALKAEGVNAKMIRVGASGEKNNAVSTGDEVEESRNRRVEINFK